MKTWANLFAAEAAHGLWINQVIRVMVSESKPEPDWRADRKMQIAAENKFDPFETRDLDKKYYVEGRFDGWCECRADITTSWYYIDGLFVSGAVLQRFRAQGPSALPRQPRIQPFRVFNFLGMDNYRMCTVNVDIDNYTPDDLARLVISYFKGKIDLGVRSEAGDSDGARRYYQAIRKMVYSNFSSLGLIDRKLIDMGGEGRHYRNLLYAVVATGTVAKVDENQKIELSGANKFISEYGLDSNYPIVCNWVLDSAPKWNLDFGDIGRDFLFDFVTDVVAAAV